MSQLKWKIISFTFVWCFIIIRDGRGSFSFMAFLLTLITRRGECGVSDNIITFAAERTGRCAFHACGPWWRWWRYTRWTIHSTDIVHWDAATISSIGHRTTRNANATNTVLIAGLTRTLILAVTHVCQ